MKQFAVSIVLYKRINFQNMSIANELYVIDAETSQKAINKAKKLAHEKHPNHIYHSSNSGELQILNP